MALRRLQFLLPMSTAQLNRPSQQLSRLPAVAWTVDSLEGWQKFRTSIASVVYHYESLDVRLLGTSALRDFVARSSENR